MTPCKIWDGYRDKDGYGKCTVNKRSLLAHRVAYCDAHGLDIDDIKGKVVMHICDNPPCRNPDHLVLGTHQDNTDDMVTKGRGDWSQPACGEKHGRAKLTLDNVHCIRSDTRSLSKIAIDYGVFPSSVSRIKSHKTWKHV